MVSGLPAVPPPVGIKAGAERGIYRRPACYLTRKEEGVIAMNSSAQTRDMSATNAQCPYCREETSFSLPENYAPQYKYCRICDKKFIVERTAKGFQVMTWEDAPCCSDPDCRAIEMAGSDEQ